MYNSSSSVFRVRNLWVLFIASCGHDSATMYGAVACDERRRDGRPAVLHELIAFFAADPCGLDCSLSYATSIAISEFSNVLSVLLQPFV